MSRPLFSIIIPVYNVETYLHECVNSILCQSSDDYEIILVNDGSTDDSGRICEGYAKKYDKINLINKQNGGAASARNIGLDAAKGTYIIFLDSDDFFDDKSMLKNITLIIEKNNCDMLIYGYKELYSDGSTTTIMQPALDEERIYSFDYIEKHHIYLSSACHKVVKSSIIMEHTLRFREGVTSEDIEWNAMLAKYCDKYSVYNHSPYIYRQRLGSVTHSMNSKSFEQLIRNVKTLFLIEVPREKALALRSYIAYQYITVLYNLLYMDNYKKHENYQDIKDMDFILKYANNRKAKLIYLVNKLFGFNIMLFCLKKFLLFYGGKDD